MYFAYILSFHLLFWIASSFSSFVSSTTELFSSLSLSPIYPFAGLRNTSVLLYNLCPFLREGSLNVRKDFLDLTRFLWSALRTGTSQNQWCQTFQTSSNRIASSLSQSTLQLPSQVTLVAQSHV